MELKITTVGEQNAAAFYGGKRRALNEGGTSSSKTYSILQILILVAQAAETNLLISVVSESMPHLKRGCIRDFINILGDDYNEDNHNKTDQRYTFGKGIIEFLAADEAWKMRGGRREILFINEANNISYLTYMELDKRTSMFTFLDWNPVSEFWVHENKLQDDEENAFIHSTYLDALSVLPKVTVENIESEKERNPNWWNVYGLGLLGKIEGLVYQRNFVVVEELPIGAVFYGLDFGFKVDPTVLVKNVIIGDKLYSEEMFYSVPVGDKGLTSDQIVMKMTLLGITHEPIFADPDQPGTIEEIRLKGFDIKEAVKGKGSVEFGIQRVNQFYQHWTQYSVSCMKEQNNFKYIEDRITGEFTDRTTHKYSHGMDARRYAVASYSPSVRRLSTHSMVL